MPLPLPDPLQVIHIIREVARRVIVPRFRNLGASDVARKRTPRDLVTIADTEAEHHLTELLRPLSLGSAVVGEEAAEADCRMLAVLGEGPPVWLLDPVDGTANFVSGEPCFAVIVAYCRGGQTLAGWIYDPIADVTLWAAAGEGAWIDQRSGSSQRARVAPSGDIGEMRGSLTRRATERLQVALGVYDVRKPPEIVRYGSVGREYIDLARGTIHFAQYTRLKPWDHAAGVLIHREAGGYSCLRGQRSAYRVEPRVIEDTLLLAPDEATWRMLDAMLG